ncbi:MAG: hypothetical protein M3137_14655 [Actinomycetota bacterium]|nr:hypothetical protein [Actinomycetota bacterium]
MGLLSRRQADADAVSVAVGGSPSPDALPGRLRVGAVTSPSGADDNNDDAALTSGVLLSPLPPQLVQLVVHLPRRSWPTVDQELPALVDPVRPGRFGVTWAVVAVIAGATRTVTATQWQDPASSWDSGPGGAHDRAVVEWLRRTRREGSDFDDGLAMSMPGVAERLAKLGWS